MQFDAKFQGLWRSTASAMEYIASPLGITFAVTITSMIFFNAWKSRHSLGC